MQLNDMYVDDVKLVQVYIDLKAFLGNVIYLDLFTISSNTDLS